MSADSLRQSCVSILKGSGLNDRSASYLITELDFSQLNTIVHAQGLNSPEGVRGVIIGMLLSVPHPTNPSLWHQCMSIFESP